MFSAVAAGSPGTMREGTYSMLYPPVAINDRYRSPAVRGLEGFDFIVCAASRRSG
jgi:hypothetical protein